MRVRAAALGNLEAYMAAEAEAASRIVTRAIQTETPQLQGALRRETMAALGTGIANAWRMRVYPNGGAGYPVGFVWTRAPDVIDGFDRGALIRRHGKGYLCIPTSFNRAGGRRQSRSTARQGRWAGVLVTPQEMVASRQAFVWKRRDYLLWMLPVAWAQRKAKGRRSPVNLAFAGGLDVLLGSGRKKRTEAFLRSGVVPMFVLKRQVRLPKHLDVQRQVDAAHVRLAQHLERGLAA